VAFSPDSRTLAVATNRGVQWWDISSGKLIAQETGAATDVVYSPDGKILAVGGWDSVVLRDASTHRAIAPPLRLGSAGVWVTGMAFSRYGGVLAVGWNGSLQFWNVAGVSRLT
jgi:WD40 repeat protein